MQVAPIKPVLKAPGTRRLKLKHDKSPSNFAFKFNLRHYHLEKDEKSLEGRAFTYMSCSASTSPRVSLK